MRPCGTATIAACLVAGALLTTAIPAFADDSQLPPLLPAPGYPPAAILVPGSSGAPYGYQNLLQPIPSGAGYGPIDAAGVGVGTNADQTSDGTPGARPGVRPNRVGPFGPTPGVRVSAGSAGVAVSTSADTLP